MVVRRRVEAERKRGGSWGRDLVAVLGRSPARQTGAETGGGYVQTVPARGDLRRLLQRRAGASALSSAPASRLLTQSFSLPSLPPARPSVLPVPHPPFLVRLDAPWRRDEALRGRPGQPPPASSLQPPVLCPGDAPQIPQVLSFGDGSCGAEPHPCSFCPVSPRSLSFIHLFMFSGVDPVSPHAQILRETPGTVLGFRDRKMKC